MNFSVEISPSPLGLEQESLEIFTDQAVSFVGELAAEFQTRISNTLRARKIRKLLVQENPEVLEATYRFSSPCNPSSEGTSLFEGANEIPGAYHEDWSISALPERLRNRRIDLGDISPSDDNLLITALNANVQGIQVDFDDGHCPTWGNMIKGIHNVIDVINGSFHPTKIPLLEECPLLLVRPRAWNMNEHNFRVNGREIPGAIFDFGFLAFHTSLKTSSLGVGPFFYLPKIESSLEARLWDDIFIWTENKLSLSPGTIKCCVLIENILASFEVERILFELRHHSFGLNCGVWDYCASIINLFGTKEEFVIPDRSKYVSLDQPFLRNYVEMVINVCHKHGVPATAGMVPFILSYLPETDQRTELIQKVCSAKERELKLGADGFLTYDASFVPYLKQLWNPDNVKNTSEDDKSSAADRILTSKDLLQTPGGIVTHSALVKNIKVGIMFIYSWLADGKGVFVQDGVVEDSATAEISRSQIWQWLYHEVDLDDHKTKMTRALLAQTVWKVYEDIIESGYETMNLIHLKTSCELLLDIATAYDPPEFITTFLYNHSSFRRAHLT